MESSTAFLKETSGEKKPVVEKKDSGGTTQPQVALVPPRVPAQPAQKPCTSEASASLGVVLPDHTIAASPPPQISSHNTQAQPMKIGDLLQLETQSAENAHPQRPHLSQQQLPLPPAKPQQTQPLQENVVSQDVRNESPNFLVAKNTTQGQISQLTTGSGAGSSRLVEQKQQESPIVELHNVRQVAQASQPHQKKQDGSKQQQVEDRGKQVGQLQLQQQLAAESGASGSQSGQAPLPPPVQGRSISALQQQQLQLRSVSPTHPLVESSRRGTFRIDTASEIAAAGVAAGAAIGALPATGGLRKDGYCMS